MKYPEPTVGAIIFNPDNKILLCKSHKWNDKYIIPGGHIEMGESMEDALRREILEETGLEIYDINLISIKESVYNKAFHEKKHFIFIDYICKTDSYNVTLNEEAQEYKWVDLSEVDNYELGGFVKTLLLELRNKEASKYKAEIIYNY
ncbi:NUDIX domain-containing protein [Alkaliphilus peptidifermentans]|uniref:Nucleoside triphosphatase n=1 Tax=Alkaliphilus peptidifermentans DSM 18978 TaxID=1120976 RepID=A0A1G5GXP2_9FIRM|nr:NUDIX domain-containing protein [Alkaliphilus peptidifermentans]SCY56171.1 nucleoside triphosphatase [Alkaliphilus peptidifermentans DSM 18978]